jgi:transglutaminase-like putative cysteine protease
MAELGLLALALGTAASFTRLFTGWEFLGRLAVPVVAVWALAAALRRGRVGMGTAALVCLATGIVVLTWRFVPAGSWLGVPSPSTVDLLGEELRSSFTEFRRLVAPVPASTGFLVVLAACLWLFGAFADAATFRYRAPVQAAIPYAAAFVAAGVLAREPGRWTAAACFGAGLAVYSATQVGRMAAGRRWVRGEADRGTTAVLGGAAAAVTVALVAGLVVGPLLPGGATAVLDLRDLGGDGGSRTVVSPFVSVRSLLGERSDQVVFTVAAPSEAYWRLTALEQYDPARDIWTSRRSYQRAEGSLARQGPTPPSSQRLRQQVRIESLDGLWLPAAFEAVELRTGEDLSWDPGTASLIARDDALEVGAEYVVTSELPNLDAAALAGSATGRGLEPVYREDPALAPDVERAARLATAAARSPYERALALQEFFRSSFTYDETVDYRDRSDPTLAFLNERRGFCQQFASTFALMARSSGLASRVAVGFTPGDPVVDVDAAETGAGGPGGDDATAGFVVRGRHAHAWPEVWFDGVGWVPFEPTPGRGNPQATEYTGVAPEQADPPLSQDTSTTSSAPSTVAPEPGDAPTPSTVDAGDGTPPADEEPAGGSAWPWAVPVAAVAAAAAVVAARRARAHRRRAARLADEREGRVALAWEAALEHLATLGERPSRTETPWEFVERIGPLAEHLGCGGQLRLLAGAETARRYAATPPTAEEGEAAEAAAADVGAAVRERAAQGRELQRLGR